MMFVTPLPAKCEECGEEVAAGTEVATDPEGKTVGVECGCGVPYLSDEEAENYMQQGWATRV